MINMEGNMEAFLGQLFPKWEGTWSNVNLVGLML